MISPARCVLPQSPDNAPCFPAVKRQLACVPVRRSFLSLPAVGFASFPDHGESGVDRCLPEDAKSLSPLTIPSLQICSMRID